MLKLDLYDKKLLYELDRDSHLNLSILAKKLKRSKPFIIYRMKKLEEEGIITGYHGIVDMSKLGYFSFRIYLDLRKTTLSELDAMISYIKEHFPTVWTITSMHGKWDLALFLGVKNILDFHKIWDGILLEYKDKIKNYNVSIYAPVYNFNRTFFYNQKEEKEVRIYGEGEGTDYDDLDWQIIQEYAPNVRQSALEISKKLNTSSDTIRERIRKMEKKKIICGYKLGLNLTKMGYVSYRVDFLLNSTEQNKRLFEYCKQHQNVYQINKSIGGANFEIEVIVKDLNELIRIIDEIKTEFREIIEDDEYFGFTTFHILNYIPD